MRADSIADFDAGLTMTLAMRAQAPTPSAVMDDLTVHGAHVFPTRLDQAAATRLLAKIKSDRAFDHSLFQTEAEFDANPQYKGVNPRSGRNLLEQFDADLAFVESAPQIVDALTEVLGQGYGLLDKKVVCGVPARSVPAWLKARIEGAPVNNLGAYVKPAYRDVTYFYGIDFHQDLIDYKDRAADFLTLYVYLHPVTAADAPLYLLEGSHALGATTFPHDLQRTDATTWRYGDRRGRSAPVGQRVLTGDTGCAAIWHPCTLHGTQPDAADHERISLRYLFARKPGAPAGIDAVNAALTGPLQLSDTRIDLADDGSAQIRGNVVREA
jgi:hypothetical protein